MLGLIAAELRTPALSAAEFAKAKQQFEGNLQASLQSTTARAQQAFARAVFPGHHPNRPHTTEEYLAAAGSAELDEVKSFHARIYGPKHMTLVLAGDVPEAEARRRGGEGLPRVDGRRGLRPRRRRSRRLRRPPPRAPPGASRCLSRTSRAHR